MDLNETLVDVAYKCVAANVLEPRVARHAIRAADLGARTIANMLRCFQ